MWILAFPVTAFLAGIAGAAPAWLTRRKACRRDLVWGAGLWLAVWLFCLCAYHRPGLTVGFDAFRLAAMAALTVWAGACTVGFRVLGRRGARAVLPLLVVVAAGAELFVCNIAYFNTHLY